MIQDIQCKHTSTRKCDSLFDGDKDENDASFIPDDESSQESGLSDIFPLTPDKYEDINVLGEITNIKVDSMSEIEKSSKDTIVRLLLELDEEETNTLTTSLSLKGSKKKLEEKKAITCRIASHARCMCLQK